MNGNCNAGGPEWNALQDFYLRCMHEQQEDREKVSQQSSMTNMILTYGSRHLHMTNMLLTYGSRHLHMTNMLLTYGSRQSTKPACGFVYWAKPTPKASTQSNFDFSRLLQIAYNLEYAFFGCKPIGLYQNLNSTMSVVISESCQVAEEPRFARRGATTLASATTVTDTLMH